MMKKRSWLWPIILALTAVCASACENNNGNMENSSQVVTEKSITLDNESLELVVGDESYLIASTYGIDGANVSFSSTDENVVTVSQEGTLTAQNEGTAKIVAACEGVSAECTVSVSFNGMLPALQSDNVQDGGSVVISSADKFAFSPYVMFNGKRFTDAQFTYALSEDSVGTISSDGVFSPKASGSVEVAVTGSWRGKSGVSMQYTYTIDVISDVFLAVNDDNRDITVYTLPSFGGKTYENEKPFVVTAYESTADGDTPLATEWEIVQGEELIEIADGKVKSKGKAGEAVVKITCRDSSQKQYEQNVVVNVVRPLTAYATPIEFSAMHGTLPVEDIFGEGATLRLATLNGKELEVADNRILGVTTTENDGVEELTVCVYDDEKGYELQLKAYAGILTEAEDLAVFNLGNTAFTDKSNPTKNVTGYYVLGGDIDATDYVLDTHGYISPTGSSEAGVGFNGTFDGKGHTIRGLTYGNVDYTIYTNKDRSIWNWVSFSLFGVIGTEGAVKNFAMTDVRYAITQSELNGAYCAGLATLIYDGASVENVYIDIASLTGGHKDHTSLNGVGFCIYTGAKLKNVIVDTVVATGGDTTDVNMRSALASRLAPNKTAADYTSTFNGLYLISDKAAVGSSADSANISAEANKLSGTYRYETFKAMQEAESDYPTFENEYWDTTCGIPVWNGESAPIELLPVETYSKTIEFSAMHGTLPVAEIFGTETTLVYAKSDDGELKIGADGKSLVGITPTSNDSAETWDVTVYSAEKGYKLTLNVYAGIITTAADLAVFNLGNTAFKTDALPTKNITGYYVLGNNITAQSGETLDTHGRIKAAYTTENIGFNGTFDGRGYTIDGLTFGVVDTSIYTQEGATRGQWNYTTFSLFGILGTNAVVKNFALTNVKYEISYSNSEGSLNGAICTGLATLIFKGAQVENVYIDIAHLKGGATATTVYGLAYCVDNEAVLKNVIVETLLDGTSEGTRIDMTCTSLMGRLAPGDTTAEVYESTFTNVYLISDKAAVSSTVDASNITGVTSGLAGVKRYESAATMKEAANDYSAFKTSGYWTVDTDGIPVWKGVQ